MTDRDMTPQTEEQTDIGNSTEAVSEGDRHESEFKPASCYETLLYDIYKNEICREALRMVSLGITVLTGAVFCTMVVMAFLYSRPMEAIYYIVAAGIPFFVVSFARRYIGAPRPCEIYPFYEDDYKSGGGRSFPSRHVFSILLIATLAAPGNLYLFISLFCLGVLLAVVRVLLGYHFVRDVIAGAFLGVVFGILGAFIFGIL